jgi:uncharacterized secreted protein with C-terminal beta-propeller domain
MLQAEPLPPGLERFASPDEFRQYLIDQQTGGRYGVIGLDSAVGGLPSSTGAGSEEFSTTNIQETGVDEADVVKNDGTYLYLIREQELYIIRAAPPESMGIVSRTPISGQPQVLYLKGDRIAVLGGLGYAGGNVTVTIVNIADRAAPAIEATVETEGQLVTSRLIASALHVVVRVAPRLPRPFDAPEVDEPTLDEMIPDLITEHSDGSSVARDIVEWNEAFRPEEPDGSLLTVVLTLNLDRPSEPVRSAAVVSNASTVYASSDSIYLTDGDYSFDGEQRESTRIARLDLRDEGAVLVGAGAVPGRLLNRFSLGEHDGYIRLATTTGHVSRGGDGSARNHVYVLELEDRELRIVGRLEDVAPGERIYSARFLGSRGFLVTYKNVDPLFTLDLSDPTTPRVVGELKVPGYSDYIHPLGSDHLLTIGKDTVDMGEFAWYQGVQLSVFDVSDFASPRRVDAEVIGVRGTQSEALYEPHAFNYFAPIEMLAVPMTIYEDAGPAPSATGQRTFQGLCLYRVEPGAGIEPLGQISTAAVAWTRGIFMAEHVYAVTAAQVQAVPLDNLGAEPITLSLE